MKLLIEGWRFIPHSYAMVNQCHCLELLRRPEIELYHRDVPYLYPEWKPARGVLAPEDEEKLLAIPEPPPGLRPDAVLRTGFPHQVMRDPSAGATFVWATSESKLVDDSAFGGRPAREALSAMDATIIACSRWAREGFVNTGAPPDKVLVVPCGADTSVFRPAATERREALRKQFGWEGKFVILNISAMTGNKGIPLLLRAVAAAAPRFPHLQLMLKGTDQLYASLLSARAAVGSLTAQDTATVQSRMGYLGKTISTPVLASLYQAADAYVSPYHAEGFNLPVLEAAACGLPVICTSGGSTDDFTSPEFTLGIRAEEAPQPSGKRILMPDLDHLVAQLERVITDEPFRRQAGTAGPAWVSERFTWKHTVDKLLGVMRPGPTEPRR